MGKQINIINEEMRSTYRVLTGAVKTTNLGENGPIVTKLCVGGQTWFQSKAKDAEKKAHAIFEKADKLGIRYIDTATGYAPSEKRIGDFLKGKSGWFVSTKTNRRKRDECFRQLENSLKLLGVNRLDLWNIHAIAKDEIDELFKKNGVVDAMNEAKDKGYVNRIGITGHESQKTLAKVLKRHGGFDFVLTSLNPADTEGVKHLFPVARKLGCGISVMKVMGRKNLIRPNRDKSIKSAQDALFYALSHDIDAAVVGFSFPEEVEELVKTMEDFRKFSDKKLKQMEEDVKEYKDEVLFYKPGSKIGWGSGTVTRDSLDEYKE